MKPLSKWLRDLASQSWYSSEPVDPVRNARGKNFACTCFGLIGTQYIAAVAIQAKTIVCDLKPWWEYSDVRKRKKVGNIFVFQTICDFGAIKVISDVLIAFVNSIVL